MISGQPADINAMHLLGPSADGRPPFDEALGISSADLSLEQEVNLRPRAYEIWAGEARWPLYCKAHDAYHFTPAGEPLFSTAATRGAVYVVRDPRAVAVSLAAYMAWTSDEAIVWMNDPAAVSASSIKRLSHHLRILLLRWHDHVESWLAAPFPVHLMRYEDMLADPGAAFAAAAAFLGLPCDSNAIEVAVAATRFSRLREQEERAGFTEKPRSARAFFQAEPVLVCLDPSLRRAVQRAAGLERHPQPRRGDLEPGQRQAGRFRSHLRHCRPRQLTRPKRVVLVAR